MTGPCGLSPSQSKLSDDGELHVSREIEAPNAGLDLLELLLKLVALELLLLELPSYRGQLLL